MDSNFKKNLAFVSFLFSAGFLIYKIDKFETDYPTSIDDPNLIHTSFYDHGGVEMEFYDFDKNGSFDLVKGYSSQGSLDSLMYDISSEGIPKILITHISDENCQYRVSINLNQDRIVDRVNCYSDKRILEEELFNTQF